MREDAWLQNEDALLIETTLHHIRIGDTQLAAFENVGMKITRTPAACQFRWNSILRKQVKDQVREAKVDRVKRAANLYKLKKPTASTVD